MIEKVVFTVSHDNQESGECVFRFWEQISNLVEKQWVEFMDGKLEVLGVEDK